MSFQHCETHNSSEYKHEIVTHFEELLLIEGLFCCTCMLGWLIKEGQIRRKRFFVLTENNQLRYYKSEDTSQPVSGNIHLNWYETLDTALFSSFEQKKKWASSTEWCF